jgi:3-dehydroquinate synthase
VRREEDGVKQRESEIAGEVMGPPELVLRYGSGAVSEVYVAPGALQWLGPLILHLPGGPPRRVVLASDATVWHIFEQRIRTILDAASLPVTVTTIPAGEEQKTLANVTTVLGAVARSGVERHDVLVALGGGVPGDLFGYVAASYMRGIRLVQVPTTLVSQVDSSIGGKVGVDLPEGKNLVGAFKHPECVLVDHDTLVTLPFDEWVSGSAEVAKHGVIADETLFNALESDAEGWRDRHIDIAPILGAAISVKAKIVQGDERETGIRMHLNYGHTLGHALETAAAYMGIRHGEAVAWGMAFEARLAARLGVSGLDFVARQDRLLQRLGLLRPLPPLDDTAVYERLFLDKKVRGGRIRWILPAKRPGSVTIRDDVPEAMVRDLIVATVTGTLLAVE